MGKNIKYLGLFLLMLIIASSCKNTNKVEQKKEMTQAELCLSQADTAAIIQLTTVYLDHLKNKKFDEAIQMLYHVKNDSISELTEQEKDGMMQQYRVFPVLSYSITGYYFRDNDKTEVAYSIEFFEKQKDDNRPNTINFRLNPRKIDNVWYLTPLNR